eukprot:7305474-Alexandrium_andersonii.AAC.1
MLGCPPVSSLGSWNLWLRLYRFCHHAGPCHLPPFHPPRSTGMFFGQRRSCWSDWRAGWERTTVMRLSSSSGPQRLDD